MTLHWAVFCSWCSDRSLDPLQATAPVIADFLLEKFKQGRAPSTLAGYRTAIAKTLKFHLGVDFGEDEALSALLRNFQRDRLASRNPIPTWDLALVLNRLSSDPFGPLEKAPLKLLTWKTVFLLALASGRRRGELHALAFDKVWWSDSHQVVGLGVIPGFLSKTQLASAPPISFSIPSLSPSLSQGMDTIHNHHLQNDVHTIHAI